MLSLYVALLAFSIFLLRKNRDLLVPIVIVAAIFGCGPAIAGRYLLDEVVIVSSICFVALTSWRDFWHRLFAVRRDLTWCDALFFTFLLYYVAQSIRTFLAVHEPSAFIYGAYFIYLGGLYTVLRAYGLKGIGRQTYTLSLRGQPITIDIVRIIFLAVFVYNLTYIGQGLLADLAAHLRGASYALPARFTTQGSTWSGSAYAILPNLLALTLAGRVFPQSPRLFLCWLGSLGSVAFIYDSRVALALAVAAIGFAAVRSFREIWRYLLAITVIGAVAGAAIVGDIGRLKKTAIDAAAGVAFLVNPRIEKSINEGDYDRYAHFYAGFRAIDQDVITRLFGYGMMMHRVVLGQHIVEIFMENPQYRRLYLASKQQEKMAPSTQRATEPEPDRSSLFLRGSRSTSFTSMLIDGGAVGLLLMYTNLLVPFVTMLRSVRVLPFAAVGIVLLAGALLAAWPTIVFLLDVTLYGLFLMPFFVASLLHARDGVGANPRPQDPT